jgi:DNA-binding MarR family transcriptional regulator
MPQRARRKRVSDADYTRLLAVRAELRRFEHWSAEQAEAQGVTASQHQLLLAVRGHPEPTGPTISQVAEYLLVRHHSAVELADRCERAGLITRTRDETDHRVVRLRLAEGGIHILDALTGAHLEELAKLTPLFESLLGALQRTGRPAY